MSKFFHEHSKTVQARGALEAVPDGFREEFPILADAMGGKAAVDGEAAFLPHSLILWFDGARLKFCLSRKGLANVCFGTVEDASRGLQGVEKAILDEHFEWKARRVH